MMNARIRTERQGGGRISYVEALAIVVAAVAGTIVVYSKTQIRELQQHAFYSAPALQELSGLPHYNVAGRSSRNFEELIIRDFFNDKRGGVFLDVGANHYQNESNTYFLETALGWSGVAVDALEEFAADYKVHRPRTRFVAMFASDVADQKVQFFVAENSLVSSSSHEFTEREGSPGKPRSVPTTTLTSVLDQAGIGKLDFVSMDIELAGPRRSPGLTSTDSNPNSSVSRHIPMSVSRFWITSHGTGMSCWASTCV